MRDHASHHHAPEPVLVTGKLVRGVMEIVDTAEGERFRFTASYLAPGADLTAVIDRPGRAFETLKLMANPTTPLSLISISAPGEPHERTQDCRSRH